MRILKKSLALLLALTMILSVVGVSVFASDDKITLTIKFFKDEARTTQLAAGSGVKQGAVIYADMYLTATAKTKLNAGTVILNYDKDKMTATDILEDEENPLWLDDNPAFTNPGVIGLGTINAKTLEAGENKVKSFKLSVKDSATGTLTFSYNAEQTLIADKNNDTYTGFITPAISSFEVLESDVITEVEPLNIDDLELGTNVDSILPKTVTVKTSKNNKVVGQSVGVNWNGTPKNNTLEEQTFTGEIQVEDPISCAEGVQATAKVTLKPITVPTVPAQAIEVPTQETEPTGEAIKTLLADYLPAKFTMENADKTITDEFEIDWTNAVYTGFNNTLNATYSITGGKVKARTGAKFTFTDDSVTAKVTVVPNKINNGTIKVDNAAQYGNAKVTFVVPEGTTINDGVTVEIYNATKKEDGTYELGTQITKVDSNKNVLAPVKVAKDKVVLGKENTVTMPSFDTLDLTTNEYFGIKVKVDSAYMFNNTGVKDSEGKDIQEEVVYSYVLPESNRRPGSGSGNGGSGTIVVKKHDIKVTEGTNGTATVDKDAKVGDTVKVDVKPNEGYKVKEIIVKTADGKTVEVDQKNRTFVMPDGDVTVEVVYEEGTEEPIADGKFTDVPDTFWAAADIYTLKEAGIINGKSDKEFDPEGKVTRAEFTKMIVNLFGVKASQNTVAFTDCKADDWFTPFVAAAVEAGYVKGITDTEFAPDKTITREEACTILGRAYAKTSDKALNFTDASEISDFATAYVALLVDMGYVNGYEDGTFLPKNEITRAEAAKIIASAFRAAEKAKTEVKADDKTDAKADADDKTEVKADDKTDAKADDKAEVKADDKTDAKADTKTDAKADDGETPEK